ncbi:alpha/beta hydrolase [Streptomyces sp. CB03911]|uniref:alpha/beta hydrolase n=1 Tax=Streptomyces sp. CB03911 TaxID=1804758 RepID=UPI000A8E2C36|nr:alpha/beta hydrolase [Streptomyces sp. CB03911]
MIITWYTCAMRTPRAIRPRLLAAGLAAGALLLTACSGHPRPQGAAPATTGPAPAATAAASPTPAARPTGAADPALKPFYGQQVTWAGCPDDPRAKNVDTSAMQCGKLHVPLDYAHPDADTIDVALLRLPAAEPEQRIGSLVVNPGGPGESGVDMVRFGADRFQGALHDRFDVVGFDPRGVGGSAPVNCLDDKDRDALNSTDEPQDPQARQAERAKRAADFAAACQARSGKLLPFVGTRNTARDLDVLREALGDRKLNYLGISYGTYLGSLYAEEFPANTGRLVLDGAVDPAADKLDQSVNQAAGFEKSLERFAVDCVRNHADDCPLGSSPDQAAKKAADFLDGLREHPLTAKDGRRLTSDLGWTGAISYLYGDETTAWQQLRWSLGWAMARGKADFLLASADNYNGRDDKGHYTTLEDAGRAIRCADSAPPAPSAERIQQVLGHLREQAPLVSKGTTAEDYSTPACAAWPYRTTETPHTVRAEGSAPILVVGSTGDPATPYAAAESLAKGFAAATLLTREGEGHGAFGKDNGCIDAALEAYLVNGVPPAAGTRCAR